MSVARNAERIVVGVDGSKFIPPEFWSALPFLMTVVALVLASVGSARRRLGAPAALGVAYATEEG